VAVLSKVVEPTLGDLGSLHRGLLALTKFGISGLVAVDNGFFDTRNCGINVGKKRFTRLGLAHLVSNHKTGNDAQRNQKKVLHNAQV